MDRRMFLGTPGAACVAARRLEADTVQRLGMQLYTVRTELEQDFDGTLAKVAAIGFTEVEFAGYFTRTPRQVAAALARAGLAAPAAHVDYSGLGDKFPAVLEAARTIGHQFLVNAWVDESIRKEPGSWQRIADTLNRAGERSKAAGMQFAYHHHHFEFAPVDGRLPFDILLERCDPALVKIELDLAWISAAGKDPVDYLTRYPGRFPLVHVKGLSERPDAGAATPFDQIMPYLADVGAGNVIDWTRVFAAAKAAGTSHYFIEHDVPTDPFASLKASYDYVRSLQF